MRDQLGTDLNELALGEADLLDGGEDGRILLEGDSLRLIDRHIGDFRIVLFRNELV